MDVGSSAALDEGPSFAVTAGAVCDVAAALAMPAGSSVRTLGVLTHFDPTAGVATITHGGASIEVSTSMLEGHLFRAGDLLSFIGELVVTTDASRPPVLQARVVRSVSGLKVATFERAASAMREFVADVAPR